MSSLGDGAGYLIIDHRDSPGISDEDAARMPGALATPKGTVTERDVKQCAHCQGAVLLNPGRVRARAVCPKCYAFICDGCEAIRVSSGVCVPFAQVVDVVAEAAVKGAVVGSVETLMRQERPLALASGISKQPTE